MPVICPYCNNTIQPTPTGTITIPGETITETYRCNHCSKVFKIEYECLDYYLDENNINIDTDD